MKRQRSVFYGDSCIRCPYYPCARCTGDPKVDMVPMDCEDDYQEKEDTHRHGGNIYFVKKRTYDDFE